MHLQRSWAATKLRSEHHYDDVIETILMGMLYGAPVQTMMPKFHSTNFEGMELGLFTWSRRTISRHGVITTVCISYSVPASLQIPVPPAIMRKTAQSVLR